MELMERDGLLYNLIGDRKSPSKSKKGGNGYG